MIWMLCSTLHAQDLSQVRELPLEAKGISCSFTEPFITVRYDFTTETASYYGAIETLSVSQASLIRKETLNPFIPQYQLILKGESTPDLVFYVDNNGGDGMSEIFHPIDAHAGGYYGGCSFVNNFGTHIVYGTETDDEPWLNLRSKPSTRGTIIARLDNGVEVNVLETKGSWHKVEVVTHFKNTEGWASKKYIKERSENPSRVTQNAPSKQSTVEKAICDDGFLSERCSGAPPGIECRSSDKSMTFRYDFESSTFLSFGANLPLEQKSAQHRREETKNPMIPENQLVVQGKKEPYRIVFDNRHMDESSKYARPLSFYHPTSNGNLQEGGCFFRYLKGDHVVFNTYRESEPWLNLRKKPSINSTVVDKLYDGTELRVESQKENWSYVQVMGVDDYGPSGWVSSKYIQPLKSTESGDKLPKPLNDNGLTHQIILERIKEQSWGKPVGGSGEGWETWLYKETLRPLGWSKEGLFAFLINGFDEAEYYAMFIIDSKTNAVLFRQSFPDEPLNEFWTTHHLEIEQHLSKHHIIQQSQFELNEHIQDLPRFELKEHAQQDNHYFLKGTVGYLKNPYASSAVTIDYYFYHDEGRGEGGTEFYVTGVNLIQSTPKD